MTLGAERRDVVQMVVRQGKMLALLGVTIGLLALPPAFCLCQTLMRSEDHVGANFLGVFARKLFGEGDHADFPQTAAEHDVEPPVIGQSFRVAQVSHNAAADRHVTVASGAVSLEESFAVLYSRFIG